MTNSSIVAVNWPQLAIPRSDCEVWGLYGDSLPIAANLNCSSSGSLRPSALGPTGNRSAKPAFKFGYEVRCAQRAPDAPPPFSMR